MPINDVLSLDPFYLARSFAKVPFLVEQLEEDVTAVFSKVPLIASS